MSVIVLLSDNVVQILNAEDAYKISWNLRDDYSIIKARCFLELILTYKGGH